MNEWKSIECFNKSLLKIVNNDNRAWGDIYAMKKPNLCREFLILRKSFYNNEFFQSRVGEAYYSAFTILNIVRENILNFDSVVDIGTGTGTWLKAAERSWC